MTQYRGKSRISKTHRPVCLCVCDNVRERVYVLRWASQLAANRWFLCFTGFCQTCVLSGYLQEEDAQQESQSPSKLLTFSNMQTGSLAQRGSGGLSDERQCLDEKCIFSWWKVWETLWIENPRLKNIIQWTFRFSLALSPNPWANSL